MGLGDLTPDDVNNDTTGYKRYGHHEYNEKLQRMVDELQEKFPEEIEVDFIEISPQIKKYAAKAYSRDNNSVFFIRVAERYADGVDDERLRQTILHEMVHIYTYQKGFLDVTDGSHIFKWLCGQVGCQINQVFEDDDEWEQLAKPFLDNDTN